MATRGLDFMADQKQAATKHEAHTSLGGGIERDLNWEKNEFKNPKLYQKLF